jgi:hypothetical protein
MQHPRACRVWSSSDDKTSRNPLSSLTFLSFPHEDLSASSKPSIETHDMCTIFTSWRHLSDPRRWHKPRPVTVQYDIVSCINQLLEVNEICEHVKTFMTFSKVLLCYILAPIIHHLITFWVSDTFIFFGFCIISPVMSSAGYVKGHAQRNSQINPQKCTEE